jgi:lipopolysaccharide export system permease protein
VAEGRDVRIIRGYLARAIVGTSALVLAVLLALGGFIEFVGQLDDVGVGRYGLLQGLAYALMKLPDMAFTMLPMAVLLGGLLGLGALAGGSEMIALRAAGASPVALARAVVVTGLVMALVAAGLGLYVAPPLERYSRQFRTFAMHGPSGLASSESAWVRDGDVIMNVSRLGDPTTFGGVYLFRLDGGGRLASVARADSAVAGDGNEWTLENYSESRFTDAGVAVRRERRYAETTGMSPELLSLSVIRPEALDGVALWRYIDYLRSNELDSRRFEVELWRRIAAAAALPAMCVLALTFAFGQLRRAGTGARMLIGIVIGLGYFLVARALADGGEVYNLDPALVGWLPTVLLAVAAAIALARTR